MRRISSFCGILLISVLMLMGGSAWAGDDGYSCGASCHNPYHQSAEAAKEVSVVGFVAPVNVFRQSVDSAVSDKVTIGIPIPNRFASGQVKHDSYILPASTKTPFLPGYKDRPAWL